MVKLWRLKSPGYCAGQDFEETLHRAGAIVLSHGDAPEVWYVGSISGGPLQEYRYSIAGQTLYAYVLTSCTIDDYQQEWIVSEAALSASDAADLILEGRALSNQRTHCLYVVRPGEPLIDPRRLADGWVDPRNSPAILRQYYLTCDTDAEAVAEAASLTDWSRPGVPECPADCALYLERRSDQTVIWEAA
jgi:hypothetical protein